MSEIQIARPGDVSFPRAALAHIDEISLLVRLIGPETVADGFMVDVGAHLGGSLAPFWQAGWSVLAFEPDPRHHEALESAIAGVDRVVLDRRAVSAESGEQATFYISEESPGISGLSAFRDSHVPVGTVETVALRDVLDDRHVDFLKIDTEGYDLFVLRGYPFARSKPSVIMTEFEDRKTLPLGYSSNDLVDLLSDHGYDIWISEWHPIIRYGIPHQWRRLYRQGEHSPEAHAWGNIIAFQEPISDQMMLAALSGIIRVQKPELLGRDAPG